MKENSVYYKVLDKDMKSPYKGFRYELGKTYSTDKPLELCDNGFHACKEMYEMVIWTNCFLLKNCRFFECTLGNTIVEYDHKVVSTSITLIREISFEEVDKSIRANIDLLVHDEDEDIRRGVAEQGYGLDVLVHDESWYVRIEVARQKYGLDILVHDKDYMVRREVAKQGYGLDILVHDENWRVRNAINHQLIDK